MPERGGMGDADGVELRPVDSVRDDGDASLDASEHDAFEGSGSLAEKDDLFRVFPIRAIIDDAAVGPGDVNANKIWTTKYTWYSWLPVSIFEQFRRIANFYFLLISVLMIVGTYIPEAFQSPLDPFSTIATLTIILLITSSKEGYEDLQRKRSDDYENNRITNILTFTGNVEAAANESVEWQQVSDQEFHGISPNTRMESKPAQQINPGDVVYLRGGHSAPVDLLIILTSMHSDGNKCYIETANIDGETNLKMREAPLLLTQDFAEAITEGHAVRELFNGTVEVEQPNANIHKIDGTLRLHAASDGIPITAGNIILRGALLSNTDWIYGIALYTGQETKIQMNSLKPPSKLSRIEQNLNIAMIIIFISQVSLVSISVVSVYLLGFDDTDEPNYIYPPGEDRVSDLPLWAELWFVFLLLYNNFIPLSLYVTIELVNLGQSFLISNDEKMYNEAFDVACTVRASNLVQELGMVSNVFSDKTGTLTCNEMNLVKYVIDGIIYDVPAETSGTNNAEAVQSTAESENAGVEFEAIYRSRSKDDAHEVDVRNVKERIAKSPRNQQPPGKSSARNIPEMYRVKSSTLRNRQKIPAPSDGGDSSSSGSGHDRGTDFDDRDLHGITEINGDTGRPSDEISEATEKAGAHNVGAQQETKDVDLPSSTDGVNQSDQLFRFLRCLMTCHTVVKESDGTYRAESPDELALVLGAAKFNCTLLERSSREIHVNLRGAEYSYEIVAVNAFNSDRKRMSVLLRESIMPTGAEIDDGDEVNSVRYLLVCKGADNIMMPLCISTEDAKKRADAALDELSKQGLRTLVVAQKYLTPTAAQNWLKLYRNSVIASTNRDEMIARAGAQLEQGMDLIGVTAIEDRLQDEVPEVIHDLAQAGIVVWMLTGDKLETAVNIGRTCNLVLPDTEVNMIAQIDSPAEFAFQLQSVYEKLVQVESQVTKKSGRNEDTKGMHHTFSVKNIRSNSSLSNTLEKKPNQALVLDGPSFSHFDKSSKNQRMQLLKIGSLCRSVVACRLTPLQKRELVALVKLNRIDKSQPKVTTLAIGDGANDVSMILEADVGIGIFGKEGRQAANNADFAIGEFKFLRRLLLLHGRWNYIRQSTVFLYSMHKNMVLTMTLFWFSFYTAVSGASPYESWVYSGFNFILGLPIIFFGILDRDLSEEFILQHPQVFRTGRTNTLLNITAILMWIGNAIVYAVVVCLMYYIVLVPTFYDMGLYVAGTIIFVGLVMGLQAKAAFYNHQWASPQIGAVLFSFFGMLAYFALIAWSVNDYLGVAAVVYSEPIFWLYSIITVPIATIFIEWGSYYGKWLFNPTYEMLYREIEHEEEFKGRNSLIF